MFRGTRERKDTMVKTDIGETHPQRNLAIVASNWKARDKNTLKGFVDLHLTASGMVIKECACHSSGERRWISFPAIPQTNADKTPRLGDNGKQLWANIIKFEDRAKEDRFQELALAAVDALLAG
jgi:hypothetical protein